MVAWWASGQLAAQADTLGPVVDQSRVVQRLHPRPVLPLAVYVDGVPYKKRESFVGFWDVNMLTGAWILRALLRKAEYCDCEC